ncbi:hypothetical protein GW7_01185 [Heterocephalus glaber]|uniref:Uncharacterized protein n=1 Tax=Heterocephalus glaber TaxID=10181 RepID=G5ATC9_HETGA|nr:hypothetical protein GW7_01185 [Heterocephalus glaber]
MHESSKLEGHLTYLNFTNPEFITELLQASGKIRLLDVGSCFNPFLKFEEFLTVGIDIVPTVESVYKCDSLNLKPQQPLQLAQDVTDAFLKQLKNPIDSLPGELFYVVVFSLLLSYLPSPYQRWICCKKAHELLVLNGLLLIITPDCLHQNCHAMMMKSCKIAIEFLGFQRFKYSKFSHVHLMAFRKTSLKTTNDLISRTTQGCYILLKISTALKMRNILTLTVMFDQIQKMNNWHMVSQSSLMLCTTQILEKVKPVLFLSMN